MSAHHQQQQQAPQQQFLQERKQHRTNLSSSMEKNQAQTQDRQMQNAHFQPQQAVNGKDLIIRMLAEVFQVNQGHDGQVRWEQISTSLVPVSLYSKTTSKWLNYLLSASSAASVNANMVPAATSTSAMSPDSRDFLMLLQQFHQQSRTDSQQQFYHQQPQHSLSLQQNNVIMFQVVAHDFIDGHCKKILNVKLAQPGTRLGQASDYFVYWKGQNSTSSSSLRQHQQYRNHLSHSQAHMPQHQFSTSSVPPIGRQNLSNSLLHQSIGYSPLNINNSNEKFVVCCNRSNTLTGEPSTQTWGLNFASVNDAKLFYDICSLNLVDLDFNSNYIKQLAMSDNNFDRLVKQQRNNHLQAHGDYRQFNEHQQNYVEEYLNDKQLRKLQQRQQFSSTEQCLSNKQQQLHMCQVQHQSTSSDAVKHQLSNPKCPACNLLPRTKSKNQHVKEDYLNLKQSMNSNLFCPLHSQQQQPQDEKADIKLGMHTQQRARSRSTTRQASEGTSLKRARSFSTPASPDGKENSLNLDQQQANLTEHQHYDEQLKQQHQHHPRCASFIRNQKREQTFKQQSRKDLDRPQKPARGVLRDHLSSSILENDPAAIHQGSNIFTQASHTKRTPKPQYMSNITRGKVNIKPQTIASNKQTKLDYSTEPLDNFTPQDCCSRGYRPLGTADSNQVYNRSCYDHETEPNTQITFGRSTSAQSNDTDELNSASHRNARLARAQYANSKNMKEFLSLDAGGVQSTPTQIAALNKRFQQQLKASESRSTKIDSSMQPGQVKVKKRYSSSESVQKSLVNANLDHHLSNEYGNSSNNHQDTNIKIQKDTDLEKRRVDLDNEVDGLRNNVATTTDDLPLDSITRKRMFRLTSEEVISEKTEPKSASSVAIDVEHDQTPVVGGGSSFGATTIERTERAVSLGPEVERALRGRSARSDAGRRRSLERSMCVDLDSSLPLAGTNVSSSSMRKSYGLSPLLQSHGPMIEESFKSSPSIGATDGNDRQPPQKELRRMPLRDERERENRFTVASKRAKTKSFSSKNGEHCWNANHRGCYQTQMTSLNHDDNLGFDSLSACRQHQLRARNDLVSFKSVPDMSTLNRPNDSEYLDFNSTHQVNRLSGGLLPGRADNFCAPSGEYQSQFLNEPITMQPKTTASLSSYAVPLCSLEREQQCRSYSRQFHSCPNSLRRKRRGPYHQNKMTVGIPTPSSGLVDGYCKACFGTSRNSEQEADFDGGEIHHHISNAYRNFLTPKECRAVEESCSFCQNQMVSTGLDGVGYGVGGFTNTCSGCNLHTANANASKNLSSICSTVKSYAQLQQQHPLQLYQAHNRLDCMTNVMTEPLRDHASRGYSTTRSDCPHSSSQITMAAPQYRPYSSQSSRSPIRLGLYDSDDGDEQYSMQNNICSSKKLGDQELNFCKLGCSRIPPTTRCYRPVRGYDQTMSRTSLKNRQRAKSQPPDEIEQENDTSHLTKSMRNVQKLINEVQNELDFLRERPPGVAKISDGSNSKTSITFNTTQPCKKIAQDNNNLITFDEPLGQPVGRKTSNAEPTAAKRKMSNDESGTQLHYGGTDLRETMATQGAMSARSATKRAGQFKCVGAIRKAGFLSVKKWILKRRQSIELARKQGWKRYWVCLRGTAMLFHSVIDKKDLLLGTDEGACSDGEMQSNRTDLLSWIQTNCPNQVSMIVNLLQKSDPFASLAEQKDTDSLANILKSMSQCYIEKEPRHLIIIEDSIAQPIPEHPKRDYVFCLSTTFGDAYLFQSSCQSESENWIAAIHNACAASIARDLTRDEAIKLFQTKVRQLELEVEKKLFLRQRLESRLTSMASMSHISNPANLLDPDQIAQPQIEIGDLNSKTKLDEQAQKKLTMRTLLLKLNQQLVALDTYIEQVHCEIYQLRCYLSSCGVQNIFYQNIQNQVASTPGLTYTFSSSFDLPHPRSLLMNVSKPTKLLLIKLGVFTVSSFHAYIHARQGSADTILQKIQQQSIPSKPLELRVRSQSISDSLFRKDHNDNRLEDDTEHLIHMSNLKAIKVKVNRKLYFRIRQLDDEDNQPIPTKNTTADSSSDDRYSILDEGEFVVINLKLHSSSSSLSIIKQVLRVIDSNVSHLSFLNYYLRFNIPVDDGNSNTNEDRFTSITSKSSSQITHYITKRKETLNDWLNFDYLELVEKVIFKVELVRKQMDEETSPFGITVGAQLFASNQESLLNVYCSYIEWGSVADKAGLKDDDEFLMINGVSVMDLDMMFVECILQDETKLGLLVRSSRIDPPSSACLSKSQKPSDDDDNEGDDDDETESKDDESENKFQTQGELKPRDHKSQSGSIFAGSQVVSDEYISSLVCPPPPALSKAFLRADSSFVRQESELCSKMIKTLDSDEATLSTLLAESKLLPLKSKSQQNLPLSLSENRLQYDSCSGSQLIVRGSVELAGQLIKKTEQLTQLLGKNSISSWNIEADEKEQSTSLSSIKSKNINGGFNKMNMDCVERLRKSILELLETEYAYIKHLETITEHYMNPLEEMSYLNIEGLRQLNQIIVDLVAFQREFFDRLTRSISSLFKFEPSKLADSELDELNDIIQHLEKLKTPGDFQPLLGSISKIFLEEAEKFKIYASYCASYSRLQKLLHPKSAHSFSPPSTSVPNTLDTFLTSNNFGASTATIYKSSVLTHRDFLKPLGSFMTYAHNTNETGAQLKQLSDFLGHLDSSSSSATSISLPKSSANSASDQVSSGSEIGQKKSSVIKASATTFQKSVHQQNFESYLIKPIQRIVRYPMLLNSMAITAQAYLDKDDDVHIDLRDAVKSMESITGHVNDIQKVYDEYGQIFANIERQFFEHRVEAASKQTKSTTNTTFSAAASQFGPHQPPVSLTIEQLLHFGEVDWLNINEFTSKVKKGMNLTQLLFVFNSCVVFICKEQVRGTAIKKKLLQSTVLTGSNNNHNTSTRSTNTALNNGVSLASSTKLALHKALASETSNEFIRYQSIIPVSEVQVRSVSATSSIATKTSTNQFQWELFQCSSVNSNSSLLTKSNKRNTTTGKVYLLSSASKESRNAFLRKIRFIIRESVRNMSLPLARSPSTKSSTPKKLSSPVSGVNTNSTCSHSTSLSPVCASTENHKDDAKDDSAECAIFVKQVDNNGTRYETSIEVNN